MTDEQALDVPAADGATVRFTSYPSQGDILNNAAALARRSAVSQAVGAFATTIAIVAIVLGEWWIVFFLAFGLLLLSGYFIVPFMWISIRKRRDLILAPVQVEADRQGVTMTTKQASVRQSWSVYRRVRETHEAFLLEIGTGAVGIIVKAGVSETDQAAFRGLLKGAGLIKPPDGILRRLRPLLWIAIGVAAAAALIAGPRFVAGINATATMSLSATVEGDSVMIDGTTDLPDGAQVSVEALQLDEWVRANDAGIQPAGSPWARYETATVQGGGFSATIPLTDWPAGRGQAVAYFWMDSTQPEAAVDRFGRTGDRLRGPEVVADPDYGPILEVQVPFSIP